MNKILKDKSLSFTFNYGITSDYFTTYKVEYDFILQHYEKYGVIPDELTFGEKFKDFDFIEVNETDRYLLDKISEQYMYKMLVPVIQKSADLLQTDAVEACNFIKSEVEPLIKIGTFGMGKDIMKNANERWDEYIKRKKVKGLLGISTGMKELDDLLHGWLPGEEVVTILGRTNEGKSWILLYFLVMAWSVGNPVLLYSGEMSPLIIGFRIDTLLEHFSNMAIMNGEEELGTKEDRRTEKDYKALLDRLAQSPIPFIVVTPNDFGSKRATVQNINVLVEKYKPKLVGIDQISLMEDYRKQKGDPNRIALAHISEDMFRSSGKYGIPFLVDAQAKRVQGSKKQQPMELAPELDEIQEADAIGQNSSRVLSIKQTSAGLKIAIKKNRYGINNREFLYFWDIDTGTFQFVHSANEDGTGSNGGDSSEQNGTEVF